MRKVIVRFFSLSLLCLLLIGVYHLSRSRTYQLFGTIVDRVETDEVVVALTFDDGPTREGTRYVLAILDSLNVPATFFVTGSELQANPESGRAIVRAGHELGNHSFSHRLMIGKSPGFVREELARTDRLIRATGQKGEISFRPPFSKKLVVLPWVLWREGRTTVTCDVEPETYPGAWKDAEAIIDHSLENVRSGSIVLLHVMYPSRSETLKALPEIITRLRERGFSFVTVKNLLGRRQVRAGR